MSYPWHIPWHPNQPHDSMAFWNNSSAACRFGGCRLPGDALLFCLLGCHDQPQTCIDLLCSNTVKSFKMFKNMALILLRKRLTHVDRWYNSTTRTDLVWCTADLPWAMVQKKNAPHLMWFQERFTNKVLVNYWTKLKQKIKRNHQFHQHVWKETRFLFTKDFTR